MDSLDSYQQEDTTVPDLNLTGDGELFLPDQQPMNAYTNQQIQEINQCYEQNYAHLRQIFSLPEVQKAITGIIHLADHIKKDDDDNNVCFVDISVCFLLISVYFLCRLLKTGSTLLWF